MPDIVVTVAAPGANEAAAQVRRFSGATAEAGTATAKFAGKASEAKGSVAAETAELKRASQAAREYARSMTVAGAAQSGVGGSTIKRIGRGISAGGAVGGMGGGLGQLAGVAQLGPAAIAGAAAMVTLASTVSILNGLMGRNAEYAKSFAEAGINEIKMRKAAAEQIGKQGVAAVHSQGTALLKLISEGGPELIKQSNNIAFREGINSADVQAGLATAQEIKNPENQNAVIEAATILARAGQSSFADAVKGAIDGGYTSSKDKYSIAAGVLSEQKDRQISRNDIGRMESRIDYSSVAKNVLKTNSEEAISAWTGQTQIEHAPAQVAADNIKAANPLLAMFQEDSKSRQDQIIVLRAIYASQSKWMTLIDGVFSPWKNARVTLINAENKNYDIEVKRSSAPTD